MEGRIETRVSKWAECKDGPWYPSIGNGGYDAYRIWVQFDGRRWYQRHEWKFADGSTEMEKWIDSPSGWGTSIEATP